MAKVWRCDRWDAISIIALLTIFSHVATAACFVDSNPIRMRATPLSPNVVLYEWKIKHRLGTDTVTTTTNILETSEYGLDDNPIQFSVIQKDSFGQVSNQSPRSDFIFAFPPFGTDLNGDGVVRFDTDYTGKPTNTGMAATMGCKSCAIEENCQ